MIKPLLSLLAMVAMTVAIAQTTFTAPDGAKITYTPPAVAVIPPPVTAGTFWVYRAGVFNWAGDYSFNANINYKTPNGIAVTITSTAGGGFQPFAPGKQFDTTPYRYLTYSIKPTSSGQVFGTGFAAINDVADGIAINIGAGSPYGPTPMPGVWGVYKIPLADFRLSNPVIQKFTIATGSGPTTYYVDNVGFTP